MVVVEHFFNVIKYDVISNIYETFNRVMLEAQNKPVIIMFEERRRFVM